jgi:GNAT superfamily N-acetyltransferase
MQITLQPVQSAQERLQFMTFPGKIYARDPNWVPPLIDGLQERLDPLRNPFWRTAEQALWMAFVDGKPAGTIAGILDHHMIETVRQPVASFGFFECLDQHQVASALFHTVEDWARSHAMRLLRGPYNPSPTDETGILVEGFGTRPAILEAHTPAYYPAFFESAGFHKFNDLLARMVYRRPESTFDDLLPEKLRLVAERAALRPDLLIRPIRLEQWEAEIALACQIYNDALADLPDFTPVPLEEFKKLSDSFKPFLDARLALIAELAGRPVGFALALPDINQALRHANGRLDLPGMLKLWWYSHKLNRVSFKILMMLPEYQGRGVEAVLVYRVAQAIWEIGYTEIDMSLTGEENVKSTRLQDRLGFIPYRRYRIYEKEL